MVVEIYGHSDDCLEVAGDINEEYNCFDEEKMYLGFSNGVVLSVNYNDDGQWVFSVVKNPHNIEVEIKPECDKNDYTQLVIMKDVIFWCLFSKDSIGKTK